MEIHETGDEIRCVINKKTDKFLLVHPVDGGGRVLHTFTNREIDDLMKVLPRIKVEK